MKKLAKTIVVTILMLVTLVGCKKSNDVNPKIGYTDLKILRISVNPYTDLCGCMCYRESNSDTCYLAFDKTITPNIDTDLLQISYFDGWVFEPQLNQYIRNNKVKTFGYSDMVTSRTDLFNAKVGSVIRFKFKL